ncbi:hypothetical protein ACM0IS_00985 [Mycoplasma aquilae ATCC BAA-1896]
MNFKIDINKINGLTDYKIRKTLSDLKDHPADFKNYYNLRL